MYLLPDIINRASELSGQTKKDTKLAYMALMAAMMEGIEKEGGFKLCGYFTLYLKYNPPREMVIPTLDDKFSMRGTYSPKLKKPGKLLKEAIDKYINS